MGNTSHNALNAHDVLLAEQHSPSPKAIGFLIHLVQQVQELGTKSPDSLCPNLIPEKKRKKEF